MEREMIEKPEEKEFFLSQKKMIEKKRISFFFLFVHVCFSFLWRPLTINSQLASSWKALFVFL